MPEPRLPERIGRLDELAHNLWWSWHEQARAVFRKLDYPLWKSSGHNPVKQLLDINPDKLQAAARDPAFLASYDATMAAFDADMSAGDTWVATKHPELTSEPIAYFSAEFAIHQSLPIYAGGLGVLAGDLCKEASDLGLPMVGVGLMYPQGYFHQHISPEGWQEESYLQLNFNEAPISPCHWSPACETPLRLQVNNRVLYIGVWQVRVGRVNLYLMDTNVEENSPQDRQLSARLYTADREQRIQQEIMLGIGGVRVLRALGVKPAVWHANEGHTAFMMLERVREEVEKGAAFLETVERVRATTIFTTHTPVPAGNDIFPVDLVERCFHDYWRSLGIDQETFLKLGQDDSSGDQGFNMTVLALRLANWRCGVSRLHGAVTRRMWHGLWPRFKEEEVPISHITNGVHLPTWVAPKLYQLYRKYVAPDLVKRQDDVELGQRVHDIPDSELWATLKLMKDKLLHEILERAQRQWTEREVNAEQALLGGALLDREALTIGFVRRFTEYKRPTLIFHDIERLKRIVSDPQRPVQIIFAGKSHPADFSSKLLLQRVYSLARDRGFQGRIAFIEDYDMHMALYLVHGVDVWLNTPRRLQEASGTSGMKASANGVLHLSVRDGWWHEGYNGKNGWAIGDDQPLPGPAEEDRADAEALYRLLENEIVPLFYDRDRDGIPHGWIRVTKEAISSVSPTFCARRMLKEYVEKMYLPAVLSPERQRAGKQ